MSRPLRLPDGRVSFNKSDVAELKRRHDWLKRKMDDAEDRFTMNSVRAEYSSLGRAIALMEDELAERTRLRESKEE